MALIELPNGYFIDPKIVQGVRPIIDNQHGPRVLVDLSTHVSMIEVDFDIPEAARQWAKEFAGKVNEAIAVAAE